MISQIEQAELIADLGLAEAFSYEEFTSAAGINGNFKINLPEALDRDKILSEKFVGHIAASLSGVEAIVATGGAVSIANNVSAETGLPMVKLVKNLNGRLQTSNASGHDTLAKRPRVGFLEDVTSTRKTTERAINQLRIRDLVDVVVTGWRRGEPCPENMTQEEVDIYNKSFAFRRLYEVPTNLPLVSVIERKMPLWIPTEKMIHARLPEISSL